MQNQWNDIYVLPVMFELLSHINQETKPTFIHHRSSLHLSLYYSPLTERFVDPHKNCWEKAAIWFLSPSGFCWCIQLWENNNKITTKMTNTFQICPSGIWSQNKKWLTRFIIVSHFLTLSLCPSPGVCFKPWSAYRGDYLHFQHSVMSNSGN